MIDLEPFAALLEKLAPGWVLLIVVAAILAYRAPLIIKELMAGLAKLRSRQNSTPWKG